MNLDSVIVCDASISREVRLRSARTIRIERLEEGVQPLHCFMSRSLEIEFQGELKLSWIKSSSRTAVILSAIALVEGTHVVYER